jgi:hypothetical protein
MFENVLPLRVTSNHVDRAPDRWDVISGSRSLSKLAVETQDSSLDHSLREEHVPRVLLCGVEEEMFLAAVPVAGIIHVWDGFGQCL